jgi:hypothetical protein
VRAFHFPTNFTDNLATLTQQQTTTQRSVYLATIFSLTQNFFLLCKFTEYTLLQRHRGNALLLPVKTWVWLEFELLKKGFAVVFHRSNEQDVTTKIRLNGVRNELK